MRRMCLAMSAVVVLAAAAGAQPGPAPAPVPLDPANPLDLALMQWEKAMASLQTFVADVHRTTVDKTFGTTELYSGQAKFVKGTPGQTSRALLHLQRVKPAPTADTYERYICSGNFLYEFAPATKVIRVHELPPPRPGQIGDDSFLGFLFGMKAEEAKKRYQMTFVPAPPEQAKWYVFIKIVPIQPGDKADFSEARLTLSAGSYLPRQLWFQQPNGNEVTWDFPKVMSNVEVPLAEFGQPQVPAGWKLERMPKAKVRS